jgi:hypothetical protein
VSGARRVRSIDRGRVPRLRAAAQLLHRPAEARHPADVARAICGAQAQDAKAGRLAFRARSARLRAADVDRARTDERSLLRAWAMRGTMHLLATEDAGWLLPLFEPAVADNSRRRLAELGVDAGARERGLDEIARALEAQGPLTRDQLTDRLAGRGVRLERSSRWHIFRIAVASGVACHGPDSGGSTCLVLARDWLGERSPHDREAALGELARRYLRAFGPATEADFAGWSGLGLRDVRSGLSLIGAEIAEVRVDGETAWTLAASARRPRGRIVRLLPAWDTYLMGHRDRSFLAKPADWRKVMPGGGILRPTSVRDGVAIGTWRVRRGKGALNVEVEPFADLDAGTLEAIEAEAADVRRFEAAS